jgi:hypothetical protein
VVLLYAFVLCIIFVRVRVGGGHNTEDGARKGLDKGVEGWYYEVIGSIGYVQLGITEYSCFVS